MRKIKDRDISQLFMQTKFTPQSRRHKQLDAAEKLLSIIDRGKEYPFEFVCFKITGFRPKDAVAQRLISGSDLSEDLITFISKLSSSVTTPLAGLSEKVYTIGELAAVINVSTKTIDRWKKQGLIPRKFIFADGRKRLGFTQSAVDRFMRDRRSIVDKAKVFERMTNKARQQIMKQAAVMAAQTSLSKHQIIRRVAAATGRAHETVRYTIMNYEKANPDRPIFRRPSGVVGPAQAVELYKLFRQDGDIAALMARFNRSRSSIYRIINRQRAKSILMQKIEFIASDEFSAEGAERIITEPLIPHNAVLKAAGSTDLLKLVGGSLATYQQTIEGVPALNREQEMELFRKYNYLKYMAGADRDAIKPNRVLGSQLKRIEKFLSQAQQIKEVIIKANLRLVVAIAKKHTAAAGTLMDLISEGNFSLMRAVEKFDYTKGFRFATYASWAIAKDYAKKIPAEAAKIDKASELPDDVQRDFRTAAAGVIAVEGVGRSLVQTIKDNLSEREQYIILKHFGLLGSAIRKDTKTLKDIGDELGLSKERVRQIELIALQKLRSLLSTEEFGLLKGE